MLDPVVAPRDVVKSNFVGSKFQDAQMEMFLQCIAVTQYKVNPDEWTPFTWEEYVAKCDHKPIDVERQLFEAMVKGGEVLLDDMGRPKRIRVDAGYLTKVGDKYMVTENLLAVMAPYSHI